MTDEPKKPTYKNYELMSKEDFERVFGTSKLRAGFVPTDRDGKKLEPKISEYAKAETYNALHGGAPDNVIAERLKICGGCEFRKTTYKGATDPDNFGWCSQCGCGNNPRALLVTKVRLAQVSCPLTPKRWDKVEGVGGSVASMMDSVKGVAKSIIHKLQSVRLLCRPKSKDS